MCLGGCMITSRAKINVFEKKILHSLGPFRSALFKKMFQYSFPKLHFFQGFLLVAYKIAVVNQSKQILLGTSPYSVFTYYTNYNLHQWNALWKRRAHNTLHHKCCIQKACLLWGTIHHSLIRGVRIQSCFARAKNFTNYIFCHPQFSAIIKILKIIVPFWPLFAM